MSKNIIVFKKLHFFKVKLLNFYHLKFPQEVKKKNVFLTSSLIKLISELFYFFFTKLSFLKNEF